MPSINVNDQKSFISAVRAEAERLKKLKDLDQFIQFNSTHNLKLPDQQISLMYSLAKTWALTNNVQIENEEALPLVNSFRNKTPLNVAPRPASKPSAPAKPAVSAYGLAPVQIAQPQIAQPTVPAKRVISAYGLANVQVAPATTTTKSVVRKS